MINVFSTFILCEIILRPLISAGRCIFLPQSWHGFWLSSNKSRETLKFNYIFQKLLLKTFTFDLTAVKNTEVIIVMQSYLIQIIKKSIEELLQREATVQTIVVSGLS